MQKIIKGLGEHLKPVKLYLGDLERILDILREGSDEVKISTSEYSLDSLEELSQLRKEYLNELKIWIEKPYVSVDLKPWTARLFTAQDDPTSRGLFVAIKEVLIRRKRPFFFVWDATPLVNGLLCGGFLIMLLFYSIRKNNIFISILCTFAFGLCYLWFRYYTQNISERYSIIIPKKYLRLLRGILTR